MTFTAFAERQYSACFATIRKLFLIRNQVHSFQNFMSFYLSVHLAHEPGEFLALLKAEGLLSQAQWILNLALGSHSFWNPRTEFFTAHVPSHFSFNHPFIHPRWIVPFSLVIAYMALAWNCSLLLRLWEHGAQDWVRDLTEDNLLFLCFAKGFIYRGT